MGKRRGVDLVTVPGIGRAGERHGCRDSDETDKDAPEHEASLEGNTTNDTHSK